MSGATQPLDWGRMFWGDTNALFLLEITLRTTIIFVWLLLLLRFAGKRGMSQLSPLEIAIVIGLGSAVGDPMFYAEVPLIHAMLVMALVVAGQRLVAWLIVHREGVETFLEGRPVELVRDGVIQLSGLKATTLSYEDLFERLRPEGVRQLGQVQRAYIEQDGQLSVFCWDKGEAPAGLPIVPPWDLEAPPPPPPDNTAPVACLRCGLVREMAEPLPPPPESARPDEADSDGVCPDDAYSDAVWPDSTRPCGCGGTRWTVAVLDPLG